MKRTRVISLVVTVFVLLAVFSGCSKAEKKSKKLKDFNVGLSPGVAHLLGMIAKEEGFAEEEGLNVTLSFVNGNSNMLAALESGKIDVAFFGSVPTITFQAAGHDLSIFGGAMTNGHGYAIKTKYVPAGFKEGDISVFKGRNVATYASSMLDYQLKFLLRENGIEIGEGPDKVNVIVFGSGQDAFAAFAGEDIDGVAITPPYTSLAVNAGQTVVYYSNKVDAFKDVPCCRQVALTSALAARPEDFIAFERSIIKAYKFTQENHAKTIEDVAKYVSINEKDLEFEIYSGYCLSHPDPDKKPTAILKKNLVDFGFTDGKDYDLDKLYNTDIYKKALAQIVKENPDDSVYKSMEERFSFND